MNILSRSVYSLLCKELRTYSSQAKQPKNHYESLGISPGCTQGEVKSAYYNLSKIYHPDKSQGNAEYAQKFRAISEAYEVLGNTQSRKIYDRGRYDTKTHINWGFFTLHSLLQR